MVDFLREMELIIGPLQEWQGSGRSQAIRIFSDGTTKTMRVGASIRKSKISTPNASEIRIYNLSEDTRNAISKGQLSVKLYANYKGQPKSLLFQGGIMKALPSRDGPDIILTLNCLEGYSNLLRGVSSKSFSNGVSAKQVVMDVAKDIPGITIDESKLNVKGTLQDGGLAFAGQTKDLLDRLGGAFGFSWSIQNGELVATDDEDGNNIESLLDDSKGLKKIAPLLSGPFQQQTGVDIEMIYDPSVQPHQRIKVDSKLDPKLNGKYTVHTVDYELDTKTDAWDMHIQSFFIL